MLKNYELLYILHPDLEGSSDKISEKIAGFIKKADGEVTNQEDWGKRKLAYRIAKNDFGVYVLVNFTMPSEKLPEIERDLRLSEEVIRFLVVTLPEISEKPRKAKKETKKSDEKPEKAEEVTAEAPAKAEKKSAKKAEETAEVEEKAEKPAKKETVKKTTAEKPAKKETKKPADDEKERMKKLDEKLEEILGE